MMTAPEMMLGAATEEEGGREERKKERKKEMSPRSFGFVHFWEMGLREGKVTRKSIKRSSFFTLSLLLGAIN